MGSTPHDVQDRLESLMVLAKENLDELRKQLLELLEENVSLKDQLSLEAVNGEALFEIDNAPVLDSGVIEVEDGIIYDTKDVVLALKTSDEDENPKKSSENIVKSSCFNCGGDHQLPACTEPRNFQRINQNRREFMAGTIKSARYHIDENQRFGQVQPGLPSDELRKALGLKSDELPIYIYRMRVLGMPPGWMKAAEINPSGMGIYLKRDELLPEATEEDGEVVEHEDKMRYDFNRLPEWPGFNAALPENFIDESNRYNVPPVHEDQFKTSLMKELQPKAQKGYVRKEMTETNGSAAKKRKMQDEKKAQDAKVASNSTPTKKEVISVDVGTPICTLYSPFPSLPAQSKWATNTTDHIMFENLPESTGKYENIRGILQKIREKKPDFENEED